MDKPPLDTLVPQRRGVGRWPVTLTTERANPLRRWNPGWGGCSAARRPVAAVNVFFLRRPVFVKRFTHEMTLREVDQRHGQRRWSLTWSATGRRGRGRGCPAPWVAGLRWRAQTPGPGWPAGPGGPLSRECGSTSTLGSFLRAFTWGM